ncbi:DNA repair protein RAD51 homolog 2-like isoform X1 [Mytilus trossulus]|uniref:DNA repair protein RAD51 homolog 2-like isoform X1 n=2 Tax=Mytilus trossulus TaxID=6551 RepID=UPI003004F717
MGQFSKMSNKKLRRAGLSKDITERLAVNNVFTCKDFLSKNNLELLKLLGLGYYSLQKVVKTCCKACVPESITALELLERRKSKNFFETTLPDLDKVLHGGIPMGTVTEIAGPSGCGKTQFCVMLSVVATLPANMGGLDGCVMYIDTESAFSAERLVQVAQCKYPEYFRQEDSLLQLTRSIFVDVQQTCSSLIKRLTSLEEEIISRKIKLIVVDSIASLVRKEYSGSGGKSLIDRTNFLSQQAAILKYLAEVFCIPVVVTNQITTRFGQNPTPSDLEEGGEIVPESDTGYVTAALGNTWSHNVNTRLILQYLEGQKRQVLVAKSPVAPFTSFTYTIQDTGIVQEVDGAGHYHGTDPGIQNIRVRSSLPLEYATKK